MASVSERLLDRPAAVGGDGLVDFGHEADGFIQGDDDFLVVGEVVVGELAAAAVFEPFVADLVAADVEVPDGGWNAFEVLVFVDVEALVGFDIVGIALVNQVAARDGVAGDEAS